MSDEQKRSDDLYKQVQKRLIASLLFDGENAGRILEIVSPEDFEEPAYELIYSAIAAISRRNDTVSSISIAHQLESEGNLKKAGGAATLYQLREEGSRFLLEASIELYARMVKEASAKTKLRKTLLEYQKVFTSDSGVPASDGVSELQSRLNEELYKLSDESSSSNLSEDYDDYFALLEQRRLLTEENANSSDGLVGIPSLLPSVNHYTGGWRPGQLITIGARTGVGKTVFAVNSAVAAAQAGKSVLFFSLEMGADELTDRIVSSTTGVPLYKLSRGTLDDADRQTLAATKAEVGSMKIKIEAEARVTIDSIRAKALRQAQSPDGLDFIIIDYLQLITPVGRFSSRQEAVADLSRNAKLLAKQLGVPLMVLVQVNRESKDDENPIPKLHQIRESGAIAQDSDIVILLHRDESLDDTIPHTLVLLEKNRNGEAQKTIRCHSNLECSIFREVIRSKDVDRLTDGDEQQAADDFDLDEFEGLIDDDDILADADLQF